MPKTNLTIQDIAIQKDIIKAIRHKLGLSTRGMDYYLSLGVKDADKRGNITYRKELGLDMKNSMKPSKSEMLAKGLLEFLHDEGYLLESIVFEEGKWVVSGPIKTQEK